MGLWRASIPSACIWKCVTLHAAMVERYAGHVMEALAEWQLIGRAEELAFLDVEVRRNLGSVAIAGATGVGKSRLVSELLARLKGHGRNVVVVRATRSTATVPFGAFAAWVPDRVSGGTSDRLAVLRGTARSLVGDGDPPVIALDDAHYLDDGSAALLLHLTQHTPVSVLATVRSGEPCPDAVVALWKEGLAQRIELRALSGAQTADLVGDALGRPVDDEALARLWQFTEGNPLYLREVVMAACAQGVLARSAGVWHWEGRLDGGTRLFELVMERLGRQGAEQRRMLELVALGEPLAVDALVNLVSRETVIEAESRSLITVTARSAGAVARLAHPLYSEVLRSRLPAATTQRYHCELAEASIAAGTHQRDSLRVATWLVDGALDPTDPALLLDASRRAQVIDEYELSARLAQAAERAGAGWRATLLHAEALSPLHRHEEVDALLARYSDVNADPVAYAAAAHLQAEQLLWHRGGDLAGARAVINAASDVLAGPVRSLLVAYGARLALFGLDLESAIELGTVAAAEAETPNDRVHGVAVCGFAAALLGRTTEALAVVDAASPVALRIIETDPIPAGTTAWAYSLAMIAAGRIDDAAGFFADILDHDFVEHGGSYQALPAMWLALARLEQGRLATAASLSRQALRILGDENHFGRGDWPAATLMTAAAQTGDEETATAASAWVEAHGKPEIRAFTLYVDVARAWLEAVRGDISRARAVALDAGHRAQEAGAWMLEEIALFNAARLGASAAAAARLGELTDVVEGPYAAAAAAFARAVTRGDADCLDDVSARFEAMGGRLYAAEAAALAAEAHADAGQRRRRTASLRRALDLVAACEGAATPLLASLDQAPVAAALTDREHEVAELASRGVSNRQIAERLGLSIRTVNSHLNHAYTKLGTHERAELATLLSGWPARR